MGIEINPYNICGANKQIDGKQYTIIWYVDDIKVSHSDPNVVKDIMQRIDKRFEGLTYDISNNHNYLGMNLTYNENKTVTIDMSAYIKEVIQKFNEQSKVTSPAATPAKANLFNVDTMSKQLDPERSKIFHHCVAKLLYVSKRCRLDILFTISFLCTRITRSTDEDWMKLKRLIRNLHGSIGN